MAQERKETPSGETRLFFGVFTGHFLVDDSFTLGVDFRGQNPHLKVGGTVPPLNTNTDGSFQIGNYRMAFEVQEGEEGKTAHVTLGWSGKGPKTQGIPAVLA